MGDSWLSVANGRRSEEYEQSMTEEMVNRKKTWRGVEEMHWWWKILFRAISWEKCTCLSSPFFCVTHSYSETPQRNRMEFFLPCFPSAVLAFSLDNPSFPFCLHVHIFVPLHSPFILTYNNSSFAIDIHGVLLSRMQSFLVSCLGHWMTSTCRWGR